MKRLLRWLGFGAGGFLALGMSGLVIVYLASQTEISDTYEVESHTVEVPRDPPSVRYGQHVYTIRGCNDCHAEDLGGAVFIDELPLARLAGSNLTSGEGGVAPRYDDPADWELAIRHGVDPEREPLPFMPSSEFFPLSDRDLGALIAYIEAADPVDRVLPATSIRPVGRLLFLLGQFPLIHAEEIDHEEPHPVAPSPAPTAAYGRYLATGCVGCHGSDFSGGPIPGAPPDWAPASNLTPHEDDGLGGWTEEDFVRALRQGLSPDGSVLDSVMPWRNTARMTDQEIRALWAYLQTVPARPGGA